ncbi:MAG TPA: phage baseplate assembly protein V [bacterium]
MIREIKAEIEKALAKLQFYAIAQVTKTDLPSYRVKAKILTTGMSTNWLRICTPYSGPGFGFVLAPNIGDEVLVCFPDGNPSGHGFVVGRLFGKDAPPVATEDEIVLTHKSGTIVVIKKDGKVEIKADKIQLGKTGSHKAAWGDAHLQAHLNHVHPTPNGPSGKPVVIILDSQVNSQQVTLD